MIEACTAIAGVGRVTRDRLIKDDVSVKMRFESALRSCKYALRLSIARGNY